MLLAARKATIAADPRERAQDLAYDAYELPATKALATVRRALKLDPRCTDARAIKAYVTLGDSPELIGELEEILADAEREFGPEFFAVADGDYRALVPARPYLRTARQLAELMVGSALPSPSTEESTVTDRPVLTLTGIDLAGVDGPVSYTHLTLPTNREV